MVACPTTPSIPSSTVTGGSYSWDFGDGSTGSGVTPTHAYGAARTYTVNLTVTNSDFPCRGGRNIISRLHTPSNTRFRRLYM